MLNKVQEQYLSTLQENPIWQSILSDLERQEVARWKKKGYEETHKLHEWIYTSGRSDENDHILSTLRLEKSNGK